MLQDQPASRNPGFDLPIPQGNVDDQIAIAKALLRKASKAREDPGYFLEFVMRNEENNLPVKLAPHQRVTLDFMVQHRRGVVMQARGASKTFMLASFILWSMGNDPQYRAAVVSSIQGQAEKVLKLVRETIESNPMLKVVFPNLRRSQNKTDPWTQTSITIARPTGTKDATLAAYGAYGKIRGSRLKAVFIDDVLDEENVNTDVARKKLIQWVDASVLQTLDPKGESKAFLIGTPLHPEDILHVAHQRGWALLKMDIAGNVLVEDDRDKWNRAGATDYWDHPGLRLGSPPFLRLTAHDPDPNNEENLFPMRWGSEREAKAQGKQGYIAKKRQDLTPWVFQTEHMLLAQDYSIALCRPEWIEHCKKLARERGIHGLVPSAPHNGNLRFMGVDLAIKVGEHHDLTAFFTYEVLPSGHRVILDIDFGRYDLATKLKMVRDKWLAFRHDLILIEDNAAQHLFVEMENLIDVSLPVKGATTGTNKAHPEVGLPGLFNEIYRGAWLIPCAEDGSVDPRVDAWCRGCMNYVPDKHTKDVVMAGWLAYQCTRKWGIGIGAQGGPDDGGGVALLMSR